MSTLVRNLFRLLASYGFAIVLLAFLFLLTLLGTLEQVDHGLYDAQKKYFESFYVIYELYDTVPIPLPGAYLVMALLFVNLVFGAIVRAPKSWTRPGMLIAHSGILLMLLGGLVTYHFSIRGHMTLYEGESSDEFESYYDWEIAVTEVGANTEGRQWVIPQEHFAGLGPEDSRTFYAMALPFDLRIEGFAPNAAVQPASGLAHGVDGFALIPQAKSREAEQNIPGAYAVVIEKAKEQAQKGILWGWSARGGAIPWVVDIGDSAWSIDLRRQRWKTPFTIVLDKFIHEQHPGTRMASNYESVVTQVEGDVRRQVEIRMNEPLRHKGYTLFQASFGPKDAGPNDRMYSVFEVVNNPADQWPLYSCIIISFGLSLHFIQRLYGHLRREQRKRS